MMNGSVYMVLERPSSWLWNSNTAVSRQAPGSREEDGILDVGIASDRAVLIVRLLYCGIADKVGSLSCDNDFTTSVLQQNMAESQDDSRRK